MAKNGSVLTVPQIIDLLGGNVPAAKICGFANNLPARGGDMRRRESIAITYWPAILKFARREKIDAITPVSLIEAHVGYRLPL